MLGNLGTLADLSQARAIVNALLDRFIPLRDEVPPAAAEESLRATDLGVYRRARATHQPMDVGELGIVMMTEIRGAWDAK